MYTFCMLRKTQCRHQHPLPLIHSTVSSVLKESTSPHSLMLIKFSTLFFLFLAKKPQLQVFQLSPFIKVSISLSFAFITSLILLHFSSSQTSPTDLVSGRGHKKCSGNTNDISQLVFLHYVSLSMSCCSESCRPWLLLSAFYSHAVFAFRVFLLFGWVSIKQYYFKEVAFGVLVTGGPTTQVLVCICLAELALDNSYTE